MERPNAGTTICRGGAMDSKGEEWVHHIEMDNDYREQTFGWLATSIESFLKDNDLPVEPN